MHYRLPTVHRFPTVEYIPLTPKVLSEEAAWKGLNRGTCSMILRDGNSGWGKVSDGLPSQIKEKLKPLGSDEAGIITLNFLVLEMMYRGNTVIMAARESQDQLGIYVITKRFFYKPNIVFEAYNLQEEKLTWSRIQL